MSYSPVKTAPSTSLKYNPLYPENLNLIKITKKDLLQDKIKALRDRLFSKSDSLKFYIFSYR